MIVECCKEEHLNCTDITQTPWLLWLPIAYSTPWLSV